MLDVLKYEILEKLFEDSEESIYRVLYKEENKKAIIKQYKDKCSIHDQYVKVKNEYENLRSLNIAGIVKAFGIEKNKQNPVIVLEDFNGIVLKKIIDTEVIEAEDFFFIAIKLTEILEELNKSYIIHRNISSKNIMVNMENKEVKLTGFEKASPNVKYGQDMIISKESLSYISPEQTGRMNRDMDYRSDYYSLGVVFYEMLTGKLPFQSEDSLELMHCHIARRPLEPHNIKSNIPNMVSAIVMKLLSKNVEDRYKSASSIRLDLEECLNQWAKSGTIKKFHLARKEYVDRLDISTSIYGRKTELMGLLNSFNDVSNGDKRVVIVSGEAGVGKSTLISELQKCTTITKGFFVSAKFEQFNKGKPYGCIIEIVREIVHQILMESEENIKIWKKDILEILGEYDQIILELIPELEYVIGKQSFSISYEARETENILIIIYQQFINLFGKRKYPLVVFYDDLQWADQGSLMLIKKLAVNHESGYLLILGTYRDTEVEKNSYLKTAIKEIDEAVEGVRYIKLEPLKFESINKLLAHSLMCEEERCSKLADILMQKTNGNPFFLKQSLKSLWQENLLFYDSTMGCWKYDINGIKTIQITDNVVDLVIARIKKLSSNTQHLLTYASYLGSKFDLKMLADVNKSSEVITAMELNEAVTEGLIVPLKNNHIIVSRENDYLLKDKECLYYQFTHDRIQQAAYNLINEANKEEVHYKVGTLLAEKDNTKQDEEYIFQVVNHLNLAHNLIVDKEERVRAAKLNLTAGKRAKDITAYRLALEYFNAGIDLLPEEKWQSYHQLTFELYKESAEHECVNGNFQRAKDKLDSLIEYSQDKIEKTKAYNVITNYYTYIGENKKAAECIIECLNMFGIYINPHISSNEIFEIIKSLGEEFGEREISELANLPEMCNEEKKAAMDGLASAIAVIGYLNENNSKNLLATVLCEMMKISLNYGNTASSAEGYICFGIILANYLGRSKEAYEFAKVSYSLVNSAKFTSKYKARVCYYFGNSIAYLKGNLSSGIKYLMEAEKNAELSGALDTVSYTYFQIITTYLLSGVSLVEILDICNRYLEKNRKVKAADVEKIILGIKQIAISLTGKFNNDIEINGKENKDAIENSKEPVVRFMYFTYKMQASYILGEYKEAIQCAREAEKFLWTSVISKHLTTYYFYYSLTLAALYEKAAQEDKKIYLRKIRENQSEFRIWVDISPHNFEHQYKMVEGMLAFLAKERYNAIRLFEEALKDARKNNFTYNAAICSELIAEVTLSKGFLSMAKSYIEKSCAYYEKWGAFEKVNQLHSKYAEFLVEEFETEESVEDLIAVTMENASQRMDMDAVIKASQAISGEIIFNNLIEKILKIAVENAGAEKGKFIIEEDGNLVITAEWKVDSEEAVVGKNILVKDSEDISQGILYYVARTKQDIVLDDAANEGIFVSDSYVIKNEPKSIMCIPIIHIGKLKGILYLENNLTTKAFTSERIKILKIFASQAAISIENASMYNRIKRLNEELEGQVEKRTKELKETVEKLQLEIVERKEIERAFRENEERLNTLINSMPDVVGFKDGEGRWLELNQAALDLLDLKREDYVGNTFVDMANMFPQYKDIFINCNKTEEKAWEKDIIFQEEEIIPKSDGTSRIFDVIKVPLFKPNGLRKGMVIIARDITTRKKAEDKLRESEERYRYLMDLIPDSIRVSCEGKIVLTNKATNKDFGVESGDEVVGKHILDYLVPHPDYEEKYRIISGVAYRKGKMLPTEEKFIRKSDGAILERETVINKIPYNGKDAYLVVARDISERKRVEELHKRMEESDKRLRETVEYDKIKTEFFANISHELRTPLNVILGTIQVSNLLVADEATSFTIKDKMKFKKYMHIMKQNCYRLVRLVNNLIDITKIDAGYLQMNWKNCNIINIVEDIALSIAEYIENKGIELIFDTEVEEKIMACDPDKIERIVLNLISNAVKFTEPGGNIKVIIFDRNDHIIISIKDTGIGIPKEKQKQIFERFVQVDKSLARVSEGSGIGLSLVKSLVEMHNGDIRVKSKFGEGSEFFVKLPVKVLKEDEKSIEDNRLQQGNIEKIQIEFSDVYI